MASSGLSLLFLSVMDGSHRELHGQAPGKSYLLCIKSTQKTALLLETLLIHPMESVPDAGQCPCAHSTGSSLCVYIIANEFYHTMLKAVIVQVEMGRGCSRHASDIYCSMHMNDPVVVSVYVHLFCITVRISIGYLVGS